MKRIQKYSGIFLAIYLAIILLIVPQLNNPELMNATQSSKAFGFIWGVLLYVPLALLIGIINSKSIIVRISIIDILLGLYSLMIIISYWIHPVDYLQMLTFGALVLFYLSIRFLNPRYYILLLLAVVISGLIQAIYGNLQLYGVYPSNHGIFRMTGSFFNPGPYAGYLAAIFPVSLGLYLFIDTINISDHDAFGLRICSIISKPTSFLKNTPFISYFFCNTTMGVTTQEKQAKRISHALNSIINLLALISIVAMCLVLPASRSRAAWLALVVSAGYLFAVKYDLLLYIRSTVDTVKKIILLIISVVTILAIIGAGLYYFKKDSADGRLLIWKVSSEMIKDKPIIGHGTGKFAADYLNYQAAYFNDNPESKEAMVAGDTNYAFNEFIQLTVEKGLVGIVLVLLLLISIFSNKLPSKPFKHSNYQTVKLSITETIQPLTQQSPSNFDSQITISRSIIISIVVFGLFSYPLQILPIKVCLLIALVILSGALGLKGQENLVPPMYFSKPLHFVIKSIFLVGVMGFLWLATNQLQQVKTAYINWKSGFDTYNMGIYDDCLTDYEKSYPLLKTNGDFLTNYGKALSMAEKHKEAIDVLQQASKYYPNTIVYTALGDSYKKVSQNANAEQAYIHAFQMNPSRFYPKYLLAKLYYETGQQGKALQMAEELLEKDVKIESIAVQEIKEEMKKIIDNQIKI